MQVDTSKESVTNKMLLSSNWSWSIQIRSCIYFQRTKHLLKMYSRGRFDDGWIPSMCFRIILFHRALLLLS